MKERLFHIFNVFDYKGGELCSHINLTLYQALCEIYDFGIDEFELFDFENEEERDLFNLSDESILTLLNTVYNSKYDFYAGYSGHSYPIVYIINDNILEEYKFSDEEKISWFRRYIKENEEWFRENLNNLSEE